MYIIITIVKGFLLYQVNSLKCMVNILTRSRGYNNTSESVQYHKSHPFARLVTFSTIRMNWLHKWTEFQGTMLSLFCSVTLIMILLNYWMSLFQQATQGDGLFFQRKLGITDRWTEISRTHLICCHFIKDVSLHYALLPCSI